MSSEAQIAANRRNALRSTGPKSEQGKAISSRNAIKHGIQAQIAVLPNERQEDYDANVEAFIRKFQPQDDVERRLVERMADCEWRLIRSRYIETAAIELQVEETRELVDGRYESIEEPARVAYALQLLDPGQSSAYQNNQRHESRLHRHYERAYKTLCAMRKQATSAPMAA
jgi:hypothetical protein